MLQANMQLFDRYNITKKIGSGHFAEVWAADDTRLGRQVAVKVLPIDKSYAIAESEAKLLAQLHHQNIITLWDFEVSQTEGAVYLIMEHAKGGTLRLLLERQGTLPEKQAIAYASQICAGLAHAHDKNVLHRDLKPENLFLGEGGLKIGDFGLARILEGSQKASSAGTGTIAYSAPEQFEPGYDRRADIWSVGIILFEMLTGDVPFQGEGRQIMKRIFFDDVEIPSSIPSNLASVINKALEKEPDERFQTAVELQTALKALSAPPHLKYCQKDGMKMVYIPAGTFMMGDETGDLDGTESWLKIPQHEVYTDAFYMDEHAITNEQYCKFLNAISVKDEGSSWLDSSGNRLIYHNLEYCSIEKSGSNFKPKSGYANHPVVSVYWEGANAYAKWVGGRLPTEAEWEKAARVKRFAPNGYGLYDMAGNVYDWCSDYWNSDYYKNSPKDNPTGPSSGSWHVARGGGWYSDSNRVRCGFRFYDNFDIGHYVYDVGFRVVVASGVSK